MDPKLSMAVDINRRTFLGYGISGLGMLALNGLVNPQLFGAETAVTGTLERRRQPAALSAQGQASYFPLPGRRTLTPGDVGPQAQARGIGR